MEILYAEEGNGFVGLSFDEGLQVWIMHNELKAWSVSEFKRYIEVFKQIRMTLRERGVYEVYGLVSDQKALKFNKMFGAIPTGEVATTEDGKFNIITRLEV